MCCTLRRDESFICLEEIPVRESGEEREEQEQQTCQDDLNPSAKQTSGALDKQATTENGRVHFVMASSAGANFNIHHSSTPYYMTVCRIHICRL